MDGRKFRAVTAVSNWCRRFQLTTKLPSGSHNFCGVSEASTTDTGSAYSAAYTAADGGP